LTEDDFMKALTTMVWSLARTVDDLIDCGFENRAALQSHPQTLSANRDSFAARRAELNRSDR
jgi:hypothetical protein